MIRKFGIEDLPKVNDICISNFNAKGEKINTDISELNKLINLKILSLKGFELTEDIVAILRSFPKLVQLNLYECDAKGTISISMEKLKGLILENCSLPNLNNILLPENFLIVNGGVIDALKLQNSGAVKNLGIKNSVIINSDFLSELRRLRELNVDGSSLDDEDVLRKLRERNVIVSHEYEYNPMR